MLARQRANRRAQQAVLFYLHTGSLDRRASACSVTAWRSGRSSRQSRPEREMRLGDPDGHCLMIAENKGEKVPADGTAQSRTPRLNA
jgi:hypothetical protein